MDWTGGMELLRRFRREETLEEIRQRVLAETSAYITECLRHPEFAVNIPVIPAGTGSFPPSFSNAFWDSVLTR